MILYFKSYIYTRFNKYYFKYWDQVKVILVIKQGV